MIARQHLVLASGSPRRYELLSGLGIDVKTVIPDVDETVAPGEAAATYVRRLAIAKAEAVGVPPGGPPLVAADTAVVVDGDILGKPGAPEAAASMLGRLSGRSHDVVTGVAVAAGGRIVTDVVTTEVTLVELDEVAIDWYLGTEEPFDKAGGYAIQGKGGVFVAAINGSYSNVVGLPLAETMTLLRHVM